MRAGEHEADINIFFSPDAVRAKTGIINPREKN